MIDREGKMLMMVIGLLIMIMVIVAALGIINLEQRIDKCTADHGLLVKTTDGWKCIDAKEIK